MRVETSSENPWSSGVGPVQRGVEVDLLSLSSCFCGRGGSWKWICGQCTSAVLNPRLYSPVIPETVCEYEVQYHRRLDQERAQWNQYRESAEREMAELRRRLTEGQEEQNLEDEMKKVGRVRSRIGAVASIRSVTRF